MTLSKESKLYPCKVCGSYSKYSYCGRKCMQIMMMIRGSA